ncbi:hypothetical protein CDAR_289021 [Caerostris darwini]|uniref:Uncharacterized protein n=1 Tax=Caerostris darwini TaxID=1538125 RepID=A0AAV4TE26_9ARAC|nr:hypothetical protein CDAR_289021 [Caerostris darwini]
MLAFRQGTILLRTILKYTVPALPSEAMITESSMTTVPLFNSEADHCLHITAAKTQLKDKEKAVEMMHQIIKKQNILIDGGFIEPHSIKPTMDGLKKAEDALAEATKREASTKSELRYIRTA